MNNSYDVIVVGGGGSGLAAAVAAADVGAKVLLLEKNPSLGGSTSISIGSFSAANSSFQHAAGIRDNPDDFTEDIGKFAPQWESRNNVELRLLLAQHSSETLEWLRSLGLEFYGPSPEPPNRVPRMHNVIPNAKAYIAVMHWHVLRRNVILRTNARVARLVTNATGRVIGVRLESGEEIIARRGVVLAAGDYSNNRDIKARYVPRPVADIPGINPTATGDGHELGASVGGALLNMDVLLGPQIRFIAPSSKPFSQLLPSTPWLARLMGWGTSLLPKPVIRAMTKQLLVTWQHPEDALYEHGAILVNKRGERFTDEKQGNLALVIAQQPERHAFIILNKRLGDMYSKSPHYISTAPDIAYAYLPDYKRLRSDIYRQGNTLPELAQRAGLPVERFVQTIAELAKSQPDWNEGPWYSLGPAVSWIVLSEGGLRVDAQMRVLRADASVIPGLYAAGSNGQGGIMIWGHGLHIAWAFTSGRLAGTNAAQHSVFERE